MRRRTLAEPPLPEPRLLLTDDAVRISAVHDPAVGAAELAIVLAHGLTGSWRRPDVRAVTAQLTRTPGVGVVGFDFRGHGASSGRSTVGDLEIYDVAAAVRWARVLGYPRVALLGFSMGASIVVRHAGLLGGVDAVVSVSGPARWYYRGTRPMRLVHYAIEGRGGRLFLRHWRGTRIAAHGWDPVPASPVDVAPSISPVPLLVVHGADDHYFPVEHAEALYAAAREPKELWIEPGMGHAESAVRPELADRLAAWARRATGLAPVGAAGRAAAGRDGGTAGDRDGGTAGDRDGGTAGDRDGLTDDGTDAPGRHAPGSGDPGSAGVVATATGSAASSGGGAA